jgi:hypothetical protein
MFIACWIATLFVLFARGYSAYTIITLVWCTANLHNSLICGFRNFKVFLVTFLFDKIYL